MNKTNKTHALELWFVTGSQHLYGPKALKQVAANTKIIAAALAKSEHLPLNVVWKPVVTRPDEVTAVCRQANASPNCAGLICWMHTFSPAKMWIAGLKTLQKPWVHLHTQFNRDLPWGSIDMDFMNLNQAAHGDREFGFIGSRLRKQRPVVVGFWADAHVHERLGTWARAAAAWHDSQSLKIVRFGDNMRQVGVTEGDKVEAQIKLGWAINGHGVGDLVQHVNAASEAQITRLCAEYDATYEVEKAMRKGGAKRKSLREAARIELGLRSFLKSGGFGGFTTTFEDLHGLVQLPGLAVQRLMNDGYGFGAEGDWKLSGLVRAMKVMDQGLGGGTSFMEDYTYDLNATNPKVLGAHMLEICPSIASNTPKLEVHPLGIGGKADPARLVFDVSTGPAIMATLVDMGNRFRMVVNDVEVVGPDQPLPKLPVARAVWIPKPDFAVGTEAWIQAGGAHHSGFSKALTAQVMEDFAGMAGIEYLPIDQDTRLREFKNEIRWNDAAYGR